MAISESLHDPRDPWAWRNPWSGDQRSDYPELWIIVSVIVCLSFIAIIVVVPVVIHRYCRDCCPFPKVWTCVDRMFSTCADFDDRSHESIVDIESPGSYYHNQYTLKPPPMNYYLHENRRSLRGTTNQLSQSHSAPDDIHAPADVLKQWNQSMNSINSSRSEKTRLVVPKIRFEKV